MRMLAFLLVTYFTAANAANCPDPGFAARSDRYVSRDDQTSTASHEPGDTVSYLCKYGDGDLMERSTHLKCLDSGAWDKAKPTCPLDDWGRCAAAGCNCNQGTKTVSCRTASFPNERAALPKDTLKLSLHKTSGGIRDTDFPGGIFDHLKQVKEIHISSSEDATIAEKGWKQFISIGYFLPVKSLEKFTLAGKIEPLVGFWYSYDKNIKCEKRDCYAECGEPTLLNPTYGIRRTDSERTLHGLRFNLDQLHDVPGHTTVHAQTVYQTKEINVAAGARWTLITREFYISYDVRSGPIRFINAEVDDCTVQLVSPGRFGKEKLILLKHGPLTIYAERVTYYKSGLTACRYVAGEPSSVPQPSIDLGRAATICAINMAERDPGEPEAAAEEKRQIAMMMFDYTAKVLAIPSTRSRPGAEEALSRTTRAREKVMSMSKSLARYVPFLSKEVYDKLLDQLYSSGSSYKTHLDTYKTRINDVRDGVAATELMVSKSSDMLSAAKITHTHAVDVLTTSELSLDRIEKKFNEADEGLAAKKAAFERGIEKYKQKQAIKAAFSVIKAIGSIIKGAVMFLGTAGTYAAGIGDIMVGIASIGETIIKVLELVIKIKTMMNSNKALMNAAKSMDASDQDINSYIDDLDKAADLRLQVIAWDNLVRETGELLGKGEVATIGGCAEYRLQLTTLGAWGKSLALETIRQTSLVRDALEKKERLRGLQVENERLTTSALKARREQKMSEDISASVYFQSADVKMTLAETLRQYCQSYFYYQLQECSTNVRPRLSDSMFNLLQKVSTAKIEALNALGSMKGTPQDFPDIQINLRDTQGADCTSINNCPIRNFKNTREMIFTIDPTEPAFSVMQRVKLEEIQIKLVGLQSSSMVYLTIETSGDFRDSYGATQYEFTSAPLVKGYGYTPSNNKISYYAKVHESQAPYFIETSPFTTWIVTLPSTLGGGAYQVNQGVDISSITSAEIHFKGSGVSRRMYRRSLLLKRKRGF